MNVSFTGLSTASTSTQLPKGKYAMEIDAVDPEYVSPVKGTKGMEIKAHVIEGMDFDDGTSTVGINRTIRLWYPNPSQKDAGKFCLGRLNELVQACGVSTEGDTFDAEDLVGKRFITSVKIQEGGEEFGNFKPYSE